MKITSKKFLLFMIKNLINGKYIKVQVYLHVKSLSLIVSIKIIVLISLISK